MHQSLTEVPAALSARQDQLDGLLAVDQAQRRTTDPAVARFGCLRAGDA